VKDDIKYQKLFLKVEQEINQYNQIQSIHITGNNIKNNFPT